MKIADILLKECDYMKKTEKIPKKPAPRKKSTQKTKKKTAKAANSRKKGLKPGFSDAIRAFTLVGALVAISALISLAVIIFHSSMKDRAIGITEDNEIPVEKTIEPEAVSRPVIETPQPASSVPTPPPTQTTPARSTPAAPPAATTSPVAIPAALSQRAPERTPERPVENQGSLVFVIDDAGNNLWELDPFLRVPGALTIAVLPGLPHSAEAARRIRAAGKEVILHQPMEAIGGQNPGPSAIYSGMSADEIRSTLRRNIEEIGPVVGMNNHQGSKVTMDREAMETILTFCAEHGLYFLDSRTTAETVVPSTAKHIGINIAQRDVFIDNEQDRDSMLNYITDGLARARRNGSVVMIGHTWSPELAPLLAEKFPLFIEQGYTIKTASAIIKTE